MDSKLNVLADNNWSELKKIIIFGYGRQGKKVLRTLRKDFEIIAIIENDSGKTGGQAEGIPIICFKDAIDLLKKYKVVITASEHYYKQISLQLEEIGLEEKKDFIMYQQFITEWYFRYKKKIYVLKTDISVTPFCSLNCEKCQLFMPYWKSKKEYCISDVKKDIDMFFNCADYVFDMDIVGGEPFLYKELDAVLEYIGGQYRNRIGYLGIITNGTIVPTEKTIELLRKYQIGISISDYSCEVDYKDKIEQLCALLKQKKIEYIRNSDIDWFDFGFPNDIYHYEGEAAKKHMECCNTICHLLNDRKLFYCGVAWAAQKGGLYPLNENDYVDLEKIDCDDLESKKRILECCLGNVKNGYLEFCKVCGGFGNDNNNAVVTGKQCTR